MSSETKFFIGVILATVTILIGAVFFFSKPEKEISQELLVPSTAWATGSAEAKVTLVEFSDFECPACQAAQPFVKQLISDYGDRLRFVFRHFPLDQHVNAQMAAIAAEAAGEQGKFWEMHDLLFENQSSLSSEMVNGLAVELKLDLDKFTQAQSDQKYLSKVEQDKNTGIQIGVTSTPTFYLNGRKLSLFNFGELKTQIEKELNN